MISLPNIQTEGALDVVGWQILEALQEDARISYSELGRRVGLSPPAVAERVRRLEDAGVISGYHAHVNLERIGFPVSAIVRLKAGEDCRGTGETLARNIPEVLACYRVTGTDDYILRVAAPSVQALERLIDRIAGYGSCITAVVLSTPLSGRVIRRDTLAPEH